MNIEKKRRLAIRRHNNVRAKVSGSANRPRMSVKFTNQNIFVQFIDDSTGRTLASVGTLDKRLELAKRGSNVACARIVGQKAGEMAVSAGIEYIVFDRGGRKYHGKVAALADAARLSGLKF